ncbi:MAG: 16S rRNA (cytosine(1402)-N(4))-methyltransferase RsmH [Dysgonamonadaceae bacterium]|jgi:16S rRNA (cytosine1402-N4)-methyltransferase|nr:16S rRNA (cytosine(1402)-N(4))-methyltransferase RsmH [Dysgonamonadaceae bacterium]
MNKQPYHVPVLLKESVDALNIRPDGIYIDATFGGGGHAAEILNRLDKKGRLYAFDCDADAEQNILPDKRLTFIQSNFRYLANFMDWHQEKAIDGILADLGVSSRHFDDETRGFSFRFDANLDMRMNKKSGKTASDILNTYSEEALADVFYRQGELRNARQIAKTILKKRNTKKIQTTPEFLDTIKPCFNREKEKKQWAQAFQALRMEVNGEIDALKELLTQAREYLKPEGRIAIITYHSLEDRLVKHFFKTGNFQGEMEKDFFGNSRQPFNVINNKVITPSQEEIEQNPRSRSAKLRIAEKK